MRPFEWLLISTVVAALLVRLVPRLRRTQLGPGLAAAAVGALVLQLAFEGQRWSLVPLYVVALGLGLVAAARRMDWLSDTRPRAVRFAGASLNACALLVALGSVALAALFPMFELPEPTGPHAVGVTWLHVEDPARPEVYTEDPEDYRELMVEIWYPAAPAPGEASTPYEERPDVIGPATARLFGGLLSVPWPTQTSDHHADIATHSYRDAQVSPAQSRYPVLVFSHGYAMITRTNTVLMEELASHGYVVASIAHTYESLGVVFPGNRVVYADAEVLSAITEGDEDLSRWEELRATEDPEQREAMLRDYLALRTGATRKIELWSDDTSSVVAALEEVARGDSPSPLAGRLELDRLGVLGMSFGGAVAAYHCVVDPRCAAALNLDGLQFGDMANASLEVPYMMVYSDQDHASNAFVYRQSRGPAYQLMIRGAAHGNLTDLSISMPLLRWAGALGEIDGRRALDVTNAYTLAFFDRYVRDRPSPLLTRPSPDHPEVEFESRNTSHLDDALPGVAGS